ncbi:MAG: tetratricopeptide repeat protein [bacterium]
MIDKSDNYEKRANAYIKKSISYFKIGKVDECIEAAGKAVRIGEENKDKKIIGKANITLGQAARSQGDYDKATQFLKESIDIFSRKPEYRDNLFTVNRIYTHLLSSRGHFDQAIEILLDMKRNHWNNLNMQNRTSVLTNLGTCYAKTGKLNEALELFLEAIEMKIRLGDKVGLSIAYYSLSMTYHMKREYDKAMEAAGNSLEICKALNDISGISYAYISLAMINKKIGNLKKSVKYHNKSLEVSKPMHDLHLNLSNQIDLGFLYAETGEFDQVENIIDKLKEQIAELDNPYYRVELLKLKISYYQNKGNTAQIEKLAREGLKEAKKAGLLSNYYDFLSSILIEKNDDVIYKELYENAYQSENISYKIASYPGLIIYNMRNDSLGSALKYAEEYNNALKDTHEIISFAGSLYYLAKVKKQMGKDYKKDLSQARSQAKNLGLSPLLKKINSI